jgi:hypothetical protein
MVSCQKRKRRCIGPHDQLINVRHGRRLHHQYVPLGRFARYTDADCPQVGSDVYLS